jgi:hypothetical protein
MKERRSSGATHSFRLTRRASDLVDDIIHPRRLGGKSRKVSDAIEAYFGPQSETPSYEDLLKSIAFMQAEILRLGNESNKFRSKLPPTPRGWRRFIPFLKSN